MKRTILIFGLALILTLGLGCKKKAKPGTAETAGTAAAGDIAKFDEAYASFREAIRFVSLTPDKDKAAAAAANAGAAFGDVARGWPEAPPDRFEGDNDWPNRVTTLTKLMNDIKSQAEAENFVDAQASILEAQKLLLQLNEKNNINTAADEAVRLLVVGDEMALAFREKRFNDMKHIMPNMREAQKNFFGSTVPASARGREDAFDEAKDKVYDGVDAFAEADDPQSRQAALDKLVKEVTAFYVEFG